MDYMKNNRISRITRLIASRQYRRDYVNWASNRPFTLKRIRQLSPADRYFLEDDKFEPQEYFEYAWNLLRAGQVYEVELKFSPAIAADIAKEQWHKSQSACFQEDGSLVLKFRLDGLNEITWWILSYGSLVEVISPFVLKHRIAEITSNNEDSQRF